MQTEIQSTHVDSKYRHNLIAVCLYVLPHKLLVIEYSISHISHNTPIWNGFMATTYWCLQHMLKDQSSTGMHFRFLHGWNILSRATSQMIENDWNCLLDLRPNLLWGDDNITFALTHWDQDNIWPPLCRRYFEMHFLNKNIWILILKNHWNLFLMWLPIWRHWFR